MNRTACICLALLWILALIAPGDWALYFVTGVTLGALVATIDPLWEEL